MKIEVGSESLCSRKVLNFSRRAMGNGKNIHKMNIGLARISSQNSKYRRVGEHVPLASSDVLVCIKPPMKSE